MRWWGGLIALVGGAAVGAGIGALASSPEGDRRLNVAGGAAAGLLFVGIAGVGATVSPDTRAAGLTAALPVAGLIVAGVIAGSQYQLKS